MGNTQQTQEYDKDNIITNRKKECDKFNACDKDKLYKELIKSKKTTVDSPRRKSRSRSRRSSRKSKSRSRSRRSSRKISH